MPRLTSERAVAVEWHGGGLAGFGDADRLADALVVLRAGVILGMCAVLPVLVGPAAGATPPFRMPAHVEHRGGVPEDRGRAPSPSGDDAIEPRSARRVSGTPTGSHATRASDDSLRSMLLDRATRAAAAEELRSRRDGRSAPTDEAAIGALSRVLGPGFARFESENVVMLSDATTALVNARLGTIERTRAEFLRWAERAGVSHAPEPTKHLCVLFASREGYVRFAREQDGLDATGVGGHYSPSKERMALYARAEGSADDLVGRCVHEAVHMVAFRTGAQTRRRTQPLWLSEGLAGAFEPSGTSVAPVAPDRPNPSVREAYHDARERPGETVPIGALVAMSTPPREEPGSAGAAYRSSAALVRYLSRHRARQLEDFMESLATDVPGPRTAAQLRAEFESHFGSPEVIERDMTLRPW